MYQLSCKSDKKGLELNCSFSGWSLSQWINFNPCLIWRKMIDIYFWMTLDRKKLLLGLALGWLAGIGPLTWGFNSFSTMRLSCTLFELNESPFNTMSVTNVLWPSPVPTSLHHYTHRLRLPSGSNRETNIQCPV